MKAAAVDVKHDRQRALGLARTIDVEVMLGQAAAQIGDVAVTLDVVALGPGVGVEAAEPGGVVEEGRGRGHAGLAAEVVEGAGHRGGTVAASLRGGLGWLGCLRGLFVPMGHRARGCARGHPG